MADCLTADSLATELNIPPGDGPGDFERYGIGPNPAPPAIESSGTSAG